ncbi:MAG: hypothetical protein IPI04_04290 [Ignavibacteria bacterium]|nr:hypothetical protein [Ignavibacteria bacterium]
MSAKGLTIDHSIRKPGFYLNAWLSEYEIDLLIKSGVRYEILVNDWNEYYNNQPNMSRFASQCSNEILRKKKIMFHIPYTAQWVISEIHEVVAKLLIQ